MPKALAYCNLKIIARLNKDSFIFTAMRHTRRIAQFYCSLCEAKFRNEASRDKHSRKCKFETPKPFKKVGKYEDECSPFIAKRKAGKPSRRYSCRKGCGNSFIGKINRDCHEEKCVTFFSSEESEEEGTTTNETNIERETNSQKPNKVYLTPRGFIVQEFDTELRLLLTEDGIYVSVPRTPFPRETFDCHVCGLTLENRETFLQHFKHHEELGLEDNDKNKTLKCITCGKLLTDNQVVYHIVSYLDEYHNVVNRDDL